MTDTCILKPIPQGHYLALTNLATGDYAFADPEAIHALIAAIHNAASNPALPYLDRGKEISNDALAIV